MEYRVIFWQAGSLARWWIVDISGDEITFVRCFGSQTLAERWIARRM